MMYGDLVGKMFFEGARRLATFQQILSGESENEEIPALPPD
jgi:hypothetical protein